MSECHASVPIGSGQQDDRSADHIAVIAVAADRGSQRILMGGSLTTRFRPDAQLHPCHTASIRDPDGSLDFFAKGTGWPANSARIRACREEPGIPAHLLVIHHPSDFDQFPTEAAHMNEPNFEDSARLKALEEKHDTVRIGPASASEWALRER